MKNEGLKVGRLPTATPINQVRETRNCGRVTDGGKEAASQRCDVTNRNLELCSSRPSLVASVRINRNGEPEEVWSRGVAVSCRSRWGRPSSSHTSFGSPAAVFAAVWGRHGERSRSVDFDWAQVLHSVLAVV